MFSGRGPLGILDFLHQYAIQCRDLDLSEDYSYIYLRSSILPPALDSFNAAKSNDRYSDVVYNWPSAVNLLLSAYSTDDNIKQATNELEISRQLSSENEDK